MRALPLMMLAALAGCSASENRNSDPAATEQASPPFADVAKGDQPAKVEVTLPQLAYRYSLAFVLPNDQLAKVQDAHRALCDSMGPARCQLLSFQRDDGEDRAGDAEMKLRVATGEAHRFGDALTRSAVDAGGRATATNVAADDLSKDIVDTKARIAQREVLVQRLTTMLRNRSGKVSELVEAERSVAQAQEELDQARGWLKEQQGRVAMSDFDVHYSAVAAATSSGSVAGQLTEAGQSSFAGFLIGLRTLLTLAIYLLPWALLALPVVLLVRRWRRRPAPTA